MTLWHTKVRINFTRKLHVESIDFEVYNSLQCLLACPRCYAASVDGAGVECPGFGPQVPPALGWQSHTGLGWTGTQLERRRLEIKITEYTVVPKGFPPEVVGTG